MKMSLKARAAAAAVAASATLVAGTAASADEKRDLVEEITAAVEQAAPDDAAIAQPTATDGDSVSFDSSTTTQATVEVDGDASVTLQASGDLPAIEIALPDELSTSDGEVADDGSVVFVDDGSVDAHAVVQSLASDSVRIQTVLDNADAPTTYSYDYGDLTPFVMDDGSVEILEVIDGVGASLVGSVDAPWAFDASGNAVPTHYTVEGNTLVQHVAHDDSYDYPVTADPKTTYTWWNHTTYFNRIWTRNIAYGNTSAGTLASWIPHPVTVITGRVLQVYGAAFLGYYLNGKCGKLVGYAYLTAPIPQPYSGSEAGGYCR